MNKIFSGVWVLSAALVLGVAGCASHEKKDGTTSQSTGEYIDDAAITTKVKADLLAEKNLDSLHISVKTVGGVVYLTGHTKTADMVALAGKVAAASKGVKSVDNKITVDPS